MREKNFEKSVKKYLKLFTGKGWKPVIPLHVWFRFMPVLTHVTESQHPLELSEKVWGWCIPSGLFSPTALRWF